MVGDGGHGGDPRPLPSPITCPCVRRRRISARVPSSTEPALPMATVHGSGPGRHGGRENSNIRDSSAGSEQEGGTPESWLRLGCGGRETRWCFVRPCDSPQASVSELDPWTLPWDSRISFPEFRLFVLCHARSVLPPSIEQSQSHSQGRVTKEDGTCEIQNCNRLLIIKFLSKIGTRVRGALQIRAGW